MVIRPARSEVTNISDEEIAGLPDEPEQRFVCLEAIVRQRFEDEAANLGDHESPRPLLIRYLNTILAAAKYYGIEGLMDWKRPSINSDFEVYETFMADVDYVITTLRLRNGEQVAAHSVVLDCETKDKLRKMLNHIRETVDTLDISITKKEALFKRINSLQNEIDRDRTHYQAFAALVIEACDDVGEAAKRLEPVVRLIERIGGAIGIAKREEDTIRQLPRREQPKQIGPPSKKNGFDRSCDEEIPF